MALIENRQIRLIAFDLDGTLVDNTVYIWSTLHESFGSNPDRRKQAAEDHFAGRISYAEWFHTDLELLRERGADRQSMIHTLKDLVPSPGAFQTLGTLKARGYKLGLISGSLDLVLDHFFSNAPFDHVLINRIEFDPDGNIAGGTPTPYDLQGKADGLRELARREGLRLDQCAFVGDNVNDLPVMRVAGYSVGVHIKSPRVAEAADLVIEDHDISCLLPLFPGPGTKV